MPRGAAGRGLRPISSLASRAMVNAVLPGTESGRLAPSARPNAADAPRRPSAPETIVSNSTDGTPGPGLSPRPYLVPRIAVRVRRSGPHAASPRARPRPGGPRSPSDFSSHRGIIGDSQQKGGRPWMGRERGGHATGPARRGTHATGSGGSPVSWDSTTGPGTRPRPRRPAPGAPGRVSTISTIGREPARCRPGPPATSKGPSAHAGRTPHTLDQ